MTQKINWDQFKIKNEDPRKAFEELSYFLFCRKFKVSDGIFRYKNQPGIETDPILVDGSFVAFSSKFFDDKINPKEFIDSIEKAKGKNKKLNKIIFYTNKEFSEGKKEKLSQDRKSIEEKAKKLKVDLEWVVPGKLEITLNQPSNLDLAQLYFDIGDEFGFIKSGSNYATQTFLNSKEYLKIPISHKSKNVSNPVNSILKNKKKAFLLIGHPGSGKSLLMHNLFRNFGGLNKSTEIQMMKVLTKNKAVPMLINLKSCISENIEKLLRERQKDKNVRNKKLGFIYLFDGLDELSEERADSVLSFLRELECQKETIKIIISCRSGNLNRLKAKVYLPEILEYQICELTEAHIESFFLARPNEKKTKLLARLKKENKNLVSEIKDILLVKLLWDTIDKLDSSSIITDLLEKKINLLLSNPDHRKNIDHLNLLDIKSSEIISLNQEISFKFQQKFQFRFSREELQKIILEKFPRSDYKSINELLNYLSNHFFENTHFDNEQNPGFIYQHRRYQEFFFTQKLKSEYEKDPKILREIDVLSGRDFFESFFLPYVRKQYQQENNIVGLLDLNLLDVYLGRHKGYGVDDSYHLNSSEFIPSIVNQDRYLLEELLEDENLNIKQIFFIDVAKLKQYFDKWKKDKNDYDANNYLTSIWESGVGSLLDHIVVFWRVGKKDIVKQLISNLNEVKKLYEDNQYVESLDSDRKPENPFWKYFHAHLFILINIQKDTPKDILNNLIRFNYKNFTGEKDKFVTDERGKDKLVRSFLRVILETQTSSVSKLIDDFDEFELVSLLNVLATFTFLPVFIKDINLQQKIKTLLNSKTIAINENNDFVTFFKTFLGVPLTEEETAFLTEEMNKIIKKDRFDWNYRNLAFRFSLISYALSVNNFPLIMKVGEGDFINDYYDEAGLYSSLFADFIHIQQKKRTLAQVLRDYIIYANNKDRYNHQYLKVDISFLWSQIFSISNLPIQDLSRFKIRLLQIEEHINPYSFYFRLNQINKKLFDKLVNESELKIFEEKLPKSDTYQEYVDNCFSLASFYANISKEKARFYFVKGIKDGLLRHGWRKDTLVSYQLVEALAILWRNNLEDRYRLIEITKKVFALTRRVTEITDGKGTSRGPYNLIELIADYDIRLAEELKDLLVTNTRYASNFNTASTLVLLGKVKLGVSMEEVEEELKKYRIEHNYEGKIEADYYEQRVLVYTEIATSDLYTDQEKERAFQKSFDLIEQIKKEGITYYLRYTDFKDWKIKYLELCSKYSKTPNVSFDESNHGYVKPKPKKSEDDFVKEIRSAKSRAKINGFYKRVDNYKNGIVLSKQSSWEALVNKTFELNYNIDPFLKLLKKSNFPHTDFWNENSKYLHFGLAVALSDLRMKSQAVKYLYKDTGHGGFINMMKVYELIGDKEMCKKLFYRYLQLCDFLCN